MKRSLPLIILNMVILVSACSTTRSYENGLRSWEGKSEKELVARWGAPSRETALSDGGKIMHYERLAPEKTKVRRDSASEKTRSEPLYDCRTTFVVNPSGAIVGWKFEGHECRK